MAKRGGIVVLVGGLLLGLPLLGGPAGAVADSVGDATDGDADHDLTSVGISETFEEVRFTLTVAGTVEPPEGGVRDFRIDFQVTPGELYVPGTNPQPAGTRYVVETCSCSSEYGVFRNGAFGYILPEQPASGGDTTTFHVPKAYLDATLLRRPAAGDYLSDVTFQARNIAFVDSAEHPDVRLTTDAPVGTLYHLRAAPVGSSTGALTRAAPAEGHPAATATLWRGSTLEAWWVSGALAQPRRLLDLGAVLWLSTTTTSPVLSDEDLSVDLYDQDASGARTLIARRAEALSDTGGADTNLFLAPGAPQRMPFDLAALPDAEQIPPGHRIALRAAVTGVFSDEAGPVLVYHDSPDFDSFVAFSGPRPPRPSHSACPHDEDVRTGEVEQLPRPRC